MLDTRGLHRYNVALFSRKEATMELDQIKAIIEMMKENDLSEFSMEQDGLKIRIRRGTEGVQSSVAVASPIIPAPIAAAPGSATAGAEAAPAPPAPPEAISHISSPMVGTCYRAPSADSPPYVEVGQAVDEETVVCIIEAMKVMNEIKAEIKGIITEVLVENAKPVEFGQKLFAVKAK
jgi:acetyl-CoA carboxylase biotin carboxyl carrier protein